MIIELITRIFDFGAQLLGYQRKKLELKNSPEMQKAAGAQRELEARDKTRKAIAKRDEAEIRREISE